MALFDVVLADSILAPPDRIEVNDGPSHVTVLFAIPAMHVDRLQDVRLDLVPSPTAADVYVLFNRDPEPAEVGVPIDHPVAIELFYSDSDYFGFPNPNIFINGVQARDRSLGWLAPFSGTDEEIIPFRHYRYTITDHPVWSSEQVITVRFFQDNPDPYPDYDVSYQFTTADVLGPSIIQVDVSPVLFDDSEQPRQCQKRIRVLFDDEVVMDDSEVGALNPANYSIVPLGLPSYRPTILSCHRVFPPDNEGPDFSGRLVDLVTDDVLTFGAPYRLIGSNVNDTSGNAYVGAPVDFTAYAPEFPAARRFYLWELLPVLNRGEDASGDLASFIASFQDVTNILLCLIDDWTGILDVDVATRQFLDAMLVDLGDPFRFTDLTTNERRKLIRVLFRMYRLKGTIPGIVYAIRFFLGLDVTIDEFSAGGWELGSEDELGVDTVLGTTDARLLNTFLVVTDVDLTTEQRARMTAVIRKMKPAGKHFKIAEPSSPDFVDHWELGLSELFEGLALPGTGTTILH